MFKSLRNTWWWLSTFLSKHHRVIVIATIVSVSVFSLSPAIFTLLKHYRKGERIGLVGRVRSNELPNSVTTLLSLGLTAIDESGAPIPALAATWSVGDDGKTYTFLLDPARRWTDGTPVTASDIHIPIESVDVQVVDKETIRFTLKDQFAPFPTLLSSPIFKNGLLGTGPMKVSSIKKNGEYIDQIVLIGGENQVPLTFKFYRTSTELVTALELGEIDTIEDIASLKDIPQWDNFQIDKTLNLNRYLAIFFNSKNSDDNPLRDKTFRQALTYSIPNKSNGDERALSPINPSSWAYNPQVKPYLTDVDQARSFLKDSTDLPTIELTTFHPYLDTAEEIARAWSDLGVKTTVKIASSPPTDFQALLVGQEIPPDPDQYYLWHSTQSTNIAKYSNLKVDKLLEDGRRTLDVEKRREIYRDFQRFLLEDSPAAFLSHITTYTVRRK